MSGLSRGGSFGGFITLHCMDIIAVLAYSSMDPMFDHGSLGGLGSGFLVGRFRLFLHTTTIIRITAATTRMNSTTGVTISAVVGID